MKRLTKPTPFVRRTLSRLRTPLLQGRPGQDISCRNRGPPSAWMRAKCHRYDAKDGKISLVTKSVLTPTAGGALPANLSPPAVAPPGGWATASDAALIAAVRSGDSGAFGVLYERHSPVAQG